MKKQNINRYILPMRTLWWTNKFFIHSSPFPLYSKVLTSSSKFWSWLFQMWIRLWSRFHTYWMKRIILNLRATAPEYHDFVMSKSRTMRSGIIVYKNEVWSKFLMKRNNNRFSRFSMSNFVFVSKETSHSVRKLPPKAMEPCRNIPSSTRSLDVENVRYRRTTIQKIVLPSGCSLLSTTTIS